MSSLSEHQLSIGSVTWFYREALPAQPEDKPPVILLHGLPSQSYSYRQVLEALAAAGFRGLAPDWIGSGYSSKPETHDFDYKPETYLNALGEWLETVGIQRFSLVVQGFLGSVGLQYALRHPDQIERLIILNSPLTPAARLPWKMKQLGLPLIGEMLTQDPLLVDRTLEGGGKYQVSDRDLDVYRRPFLTTSASGRALLATIRQLQLPKVTAEIETGFAEWTGAVLIAWGLQDPWLPLSMAENFAQQVKKADLIKLDQLGHYPQQDWHQKVSEAVVPFLRKLIV